MVAYSDAQSMSFEFKHIGDKLAITVPIDGVKIIKLACSRPIAGQAEISLDNSGTPATTPTKGSRIIYLTCSDADGFKKGSTYYSCLSPTAASEIRLAFFTNDNKTTGKRYRSNIGEMNRATINKADPTGKKNWDAGPIVLDCNDGILGPIFFHSISWLSTTYISLTFDYWDNVDVADMENMLSTASKEVADQWVRTEDSGIPYKDKNGNYYILYDDEIRPTPGYFVFPQNFKKFFLDFERSDLK